MSALYNAFAQRFPEVADLWKTLCAEECAHGKLSRTAVHLEDSLIESQVFVDTNGDSPGVKEVLGTLTGQTERLRKHLSESLENYLSP